MDKMTDEYRFDHHKLHYHPKRVAQWLSGDLIYPLYIEISPSGACNHRCTFCAFDYMGYRARFLDSTVFMRRLNEMKSLGVKSVMYAGEGEPLLHPEIARLVKHANDAGLDVAMTSNGVLFDKQKAEDMLPNMKWIKFSVNAGCRGTYSRVHRTKEADFDKVIQNIRDAVEIRRGRDLSCTIGMQMLLLSDNRNEIIEFVKRAKETGADYAVIKPYSQHALSNKNDSANIVYKKDRAIYKRLQQYNSDGFMVFVRENAMKKWDDKERKYDRCLGLPFWCYIDSGGNVWGCSSYLGKDDFCFGNICGQTFQDVWEGERRSRFLREIDDLIDVSQCRINCRMDEVNKYLWELAHPGQHVNFI